jgi:hypothetical protein
MTNPRTTWAGIVTIVGALLTFGGSALATKSVPSVEAWSALGAALLMGYGLIAAKDGK